MTEEITTPPAPDATADTAEFSTWFATQPKEIQDRFTAQYGKLDTALKSERQISAANKEAAAKLAKFEAAEAARIEAEKSETQKALDAKTAAEQDAATARAELATERVKNATLAEAGKYAFGADAKMKFINPERAYQLVMADPANKSIEAAAVLDALKALAKSDPWMLEAQTQQQRVTTPQEGRRTTTNQTTPAQKEAPTRY